MNLEMFGNFMIGFIVGGILGFFLCAVFSQPKKHEIDEHEELTK